MARRHCRIGDYKQSKLLETFVGGVPARTAAELVGVNRHSATLFAAIAKATGAVALLARSRSSAF